MKTNRVSSSRLKSAIHRLVAAALSLALVLVICVMAEFWTRMTEPNDQRPIWQRNDALRQGLPEQELAEFLRDVERAPSDKPWVYRQYGYYSLRPFTTPKIEIKAPYSARRCPASSPIEAAHVRIWFFGGSTMQDMGVIDARTLANQVVKRLQDHHGLLVHGSNFGTGSFQSSLEALRFIGLLRESDLAHPTVVVFYDGFNDARHTARFGAGNIQRDIREKFRLLVEQDYGSLALYGAAEWLAEKSAFLRRYAAPTLTPKNIRKSTPPNYSHENLVKGVRTYRTNLRIIRAICREFGIVPVFALQPLVVTKLGLGAIDKESFDALPPNQVHFVRQFYAETIAAASEEPGFIDLSRVLDNNGRSDFRDLGHTGPFTQVDIATPLADFIIARLTQSRNPDLTAPANQGRGFPR